MLSAQASILFLSESRKGNGLPARSSPPYWLWALLPLLLAAALAIPFLDADAFNGDEPASLLAAGILHEDPWTLVDTWRFISVSDPHQAHGWALLLFFHGRIVGWSLVAIRALPFFLGMLALAWSYRCGRDFFAPGPALATVTLLAGSVFFLAYLTHARAFSLVALCTVICLWSYWRIALQPRGAGFGAMALFLAGSVGLLYAHYFSALFLPVLALFHTLFMAKNRRWRQPVILLVLAALLAIPQLPGFLRGLERTTGDLALGSVALESIDLLARLAHRLTNSIVPPTGAVGTALTVIIPAAFLYLAWRRRRSGHRTDALWVLLFISLAFLLVAIGVNELVGTLIDDRIRYLMPLWPLVALAAGAGLWRLSGRWRLPAIVLLAAWSGLGAALSHSPDFRYELGFFFRTDVHRVFQQLEGLTSPDDLLVLDDHVAGGYSLQLHAGLLQLPWKVFHRAWEVPHERVAAVNDRYQRLWLVYRSRDRDLFRDLPERLGHSLCERSLDKWGFSVDLLTRSAQDCQYAAARLETEVGLALAAPQITMDEGVLLLKAAVNSPDVELPARFSLALHLVAADREERVAQRDVGLGRGRFIPLYSEFDISALPPGNYEVRAALYDWQTGERLNARDLQTGAVSDMHVLHRFSID